MEEILEKVGVVMALTPGTIKVWFESGQAMGKDYMIIVCDTFSYEDYPVYAHGNGDFLEKYSRYNGKNMQRIMEVYDLNMDMETQLDETRAFHGPEGFVF